MKEFVRGFWGYVLLLAVCVYRNAFAGTPGEKERAHRRAGPVTTVVTAQQLTFDYGASTARFEGNVVATDGTVTLTADRLTLVFSGTNELTSAEGTGHVRFEHPEGTGTCERAVYSLDRRTIVLAGQAKLERATDAIQADEIVFLLDGRQIRHIRAIGNVRMDHRGSGLQRAPFLLLPEGKKLSR